MQDLSDSIDGGFYRYQQEFTRLHAELIKAGQPPNDRDLIEWIKKGICNTDVKKFMAQFFFTGAQEISSDDLFSRIREYLQFLMLSSDPIDPYKVVSNHHGSISAKLGQIDIGGKRQTTFEKGDFSDGNKNQRKQGHGDRHGNSNYERRCTRCWHKGHGWSTCHSTKCAVCGTVLNATMGYCPNYKNHTEPGTNWRYEKSTKADGNGAKSGNPTDADLQAKREAVKEARKALKTAFKASKKQKN